MCLFSSEVSISYLYNVAMTFYMGVDWLCHFGTSQFVSLFVSPGTSCSA